MDIALLAEGTYPYHPGGVSVWCDQLVRGLAPTGSTSTRSSVATTTSPAGSSPTTSSACHPIQLWGGAPSSRQSKASSAELNAVFSQLASSMVEANGEPAFLEALRHLFELSLERPLTGALQSKESLEILLGAMQLAGPTNRRLAGTAASATVSDARIALELIEHQLRPLFVPPQGGHLPRHRKRPLRAPRPRGLLVPSHAPCAE